MGNSKNVTPEMVAKVLGCFFVARALEVRTALETVEPLFAEQFARIADERAASWLLGNLRSEERYQEAAFIAAAIREKGAARD